ncbi:hypothetical protein KC362_g89 [Hortaea werneckii]|nr:hypothetical protein KC362_g89 [Hortaea werneckii]
MKAVIERKMRHVLQDVGFLLVARNKAQKQRMIFDALLLKCSRRCLPTLGSVSKVSVPGSCHLSTVLRRWNGLHLLIVKHIIIFVMRTRRDVFYILTRRQSRTECCFRFGKAETGKPYGHRDLLAIDHGARQVPWTVSRVTGTSRAAYCWGHVATAESQHAGIECSFLFWRHAHLINRVASTRRGEVSIESHLKLFWCTK